MEDDLARRTTNSSDSDSSDTEVKNPIWLSVSEAAKFGGVTTKTIRRAIQSKAIKYKVVKNRYLIELSSVVAFLNSSIKLKNKFSQYGFGQYVASWREE